MAWKLKFAAALGLLLVAAQSSWARTYYINKGVKYHVGDDRSGRSEDARFLGTYPVVGKIWEQAFSVDRPDVVKVRIDRIWGVDDCPYCRATVAVVELRPGEASEREHRMGRLRRENNRRPWSTPEPLGFRVEPGRLYKLRIQSWGESQADDFVVEDVSVESQVAVVSFPQGPVIRMPEAPPPPPPPAEICPGQRDLSRWPFAAPSLQPRVGRRGFAETPALARLGPGEQASFAVSVQPGAAEDRLGRSLRIHVGGQSAAWVLTLDAAGGVAHANSFLRGEYRQASFAAPGFRPGRWNQLTVAYCRDGLWHLALNGTWLAGTLPGQGPAEVSLRAEGLGLGVGKRELAR